MITAAQARESGLDHSAVRRRVVSGRWVKLGRGIFVVSGAPRTWHQRVMALCLATTGVASHLSAARLHRLAFLPQARDIEVSVDRNRSIRSPLGRVHTTGVGSSPWRT